MKVPVILLSLAAPGVALQSTLAFVPSSSLPKSPQLQLSMLPDTGDRVSVDRRNLLLRTGPFIAASILLGFDGAKPAGAIPEQKVYSSNAKNMMSLRRRQLGDEVMKMTRMKPRWMNSPI